MRDLAAGNRCSTCLTWARERTDGPTAAVCQGGQYRSLGRDWISMVKTGDAHPRTLPQLFPRAQILKTVHSPKR